MGPLGAAASLLTIISATAFVTKSATRLLEAWQDAPEQIKSLAQLLTTIGQELESIRDVTAHGRASLHNAMMYQALGEQPGQVEARLWSIESLRSRVDGYGRVKQAARWAVKDRQALDRQFATLDPQQDRLRMWLLIMTM